MSSKVTKFLLGIAGMAALAVGGSAIAGAATSKGATTTTTSPSAPPGRSPLPGPGSAAHEAAEQPVTGTAADEAQAAALKAIGRGTAGAVTTDCSGTGYEVTVTRSDGSTVEVHLDGSFQVLQHAGPGGGPPSGPPASA